MRLSSLVVAVVAAVFLGSDAVAGADTAPFLAFTSRRSIASEKGGVAAARMSPSSPYVSPQDVVDSLIKKGSDICGLDAAVIVEVEDLQPHSFRTLATDSYLRTRALEAPSQLAFPHVSLSHGDTALQLQHTLQRLCAKAWKGANRIETLRINSLDDQDLSSSLSRIAERHADHLVVVTSATRTLRMTKRAPSNSGDNNSTDPVMDSSLGLLHRYQFFSTGLLTALLVMVFLLVPAVYFAVGLLSSIETPDRLGEKTRSSGEKKGQ